MHRAHAVANMLCQARIARPALGGHKGTKGHMLCGAAEALTGMSNMRKTSGTGAWCAAVNWRHAQRGSWGMAGWAARVGGRASFLKAKDTHDAATPPSKASGVLLHAYALVLPIRPLYSRGHPAVLRTACQQSSSQSSSSLQNPLQAPAGHWYARTQDVSGVAAGPFL